MLDEIFATISETTMSLTVFIFWLICLYFLEVQERRSTEDMLDELRNYLATQFGLLRAEEAQFNRDMVVVIRNAMERMRPAGGNNL
ncbi:hypothetical protein HOY82DRAFT_672738 [Tuber indicum]|nr:hypothetical protein HOY82DRAFT_672738 [Tuber indicum]